MKMNIIKAIASVVLGITVAGCAKWNSTESLPLDTSHPWDREPELWEDYKSAIRDYKARKHSLVYVRFENSPENPVSEKGYMRCLPDSLDIVSLTNADNFSKFDAEDMEWMRSIGTKVLYNVDYAGRKDILGDEAALYSYLDMVIASVKKNGLDGYSFTGTPKAGDASVAAASAKIVGTLSSARTAGQLLVFEGDPAFIADEDMDKITLFVLESELDENSYQMRGTIEDASERGISKDRMLLAVSFEGVYYNESNAEVPVIEAMADNTVSYGPMAGLALYDIEKDYYHYEGNWLTLRSTIERLNPGK